jgi:pimeloyl-ACP methyl ester carboxylesterase
MATIPTLLILHGALGSKDQFIGLENQLGEELLVERLNFRSHGGRFMSEAPFRIEAFAEDVLMWLEKNKQDRIDILGYSMGGYVALYLARHFPDKVGKICTLATKWDWNAESVDRELKFLNPELIQEKVPRYAETLKERHAPEDWEAIVRRTAEMMTHMADQPPLKEEDFAKIPHEVLIALGDQDSTASLAPSIRTFQALAKGQLLVLPDTPHPIERVHIPSFAQQVLHFLAERE